MSRALGDCEVSLQPTPLPLEWVATLLTALLYSAGEIARAAFDVGRYDATVDVRYLHFVRLRAHVAIGRLPVVVRLPRSRPSTDFDALNRELVALYEQLVPNGVVGLLQFEGDLTFDGTFDVAPRNVASHTAVAGAQVPFTATAIADLIEGSRTQVDVAFGAFGVRGDGALIDDGDDHLAIAVAGDFHTRAAHGRIVVVGGIHRAEELTIARDDVRNGVGVTARDGVTTVDFRGTLVEPIVGDGTVAVVATHVFALACNRARFSDYWFWVYGVAERRYELQVIDPEVESRRGTFLARDLERQPQELSWVEVGCGAPLLLLQIRERYGVQRPLVVQWDGLAVGIQTTLRARSTCCCIHGGGDGQLQPDVAAAFGIKRETLVSACVER